MPSTKACRIIPLGGLGEVGKNMTVFEHSGEAIVVDAGLAFPRDEHLGVDLVLPDFCYLRARAKPVRAVILTHGHEDHVGGLPYLLREVRGPGGLGDAADARPRQVEAGRARARRARPSCARSSPESAPVEIGPFRLEFVRMAHSIPDAIAVVIETAAGRIVYTGDYKIDHTPVDGMRTDVGRLAEIGNRGVDLMLGDSTNAERPGTTPLRAPGRRGLPADRPAARQGASWSPASPRTSIAMQQASTSRSRPGARSPSSAARCART